MPTVRATVTVNAELLEKAQRRARLSGKARALRTAHALFDFGTRLSRRGLASAG
jgi:hypothetical protein